MTGRSHNDILLRAAVCFDDYVCDSRECFDLPLSLVFQYLCVSRKFLETFLSLPFLVATGENVLWGFKMDMEDSVTVCFSDGFNLIRDPNSIYNNDSIVVQSLRDS